jgi:hypothetical protein
VAEASGEVGDGADGVRHWISADSDGNSPLSRLGLVFVRTAMATTSSSDYYNHKSFWGGGRPIVGGGMAVWLDDNGTAGAVAGRPAAVKAGGAKLGGRSRGT